MTVYNGEQFLAEAIASILSQTLADFEFLIIDDGSTDASVEVIGSFADPRIRLICNERNMGLAFSLNKGLAMARSKYIARMDADDVSRPQRLETQVAFMYANPEVGVCGSWLETFGAESKKTWRPPADDARIRCEHIFHSDLYHPTVMLRKDLFDRNNLAYNGPWVEDYDLWVRASQYMRLANIPQTLLLHRMHSDNFGKIFAKEQNQCAQEVRLRQIRQLGIEPYPEEAELHADISLARFRKTSEFMNQSEQWLLKLQQANRSRQVFQKPIFSEILSNKWFELCNAASDLGFKTLRTFLRSPLRARRPFNNYNQIKLVIKCCLRY